MNALQQCSEVLGTPAWTASQHLQWQSELMMTLEIKQLCVTHWTITYLLYSQRGKASLHAYVDDWQ